MLGLRLDDDGEEDNKGIEEELVVVGFTFSETSSVHLHKTNIFVVKWKGSNQNIDILMG